MRAGVLASRRMSWFYRSFIRPFLFAQDSEDVHNRTLSALALASRHETLCEALESFYAAPALPSTIFGLHFPNPVGLAAGMDKHAAAVPAWAALGFGFSELGGVTWHPQLGNPAPRMFRAVADEALVNRMGFNNAGARAMAGKLAGWRFLNRWPAHPVGVNLGKSKSTPLEEASDDYAKSFQALRPYADFFVVNVSSPNTPNLRQLQDKHALREILSAIQSLNQSDSLATTKPILVKIAPDLSFEAIDEILALIESCRVAGLVATNTTIARPSAADPHTLAAYAQTGGLSGKPLSARSTEVIRYIYRQSKGAVPIVGVGGIFNAEDAWEKITAGAALVQIYTGLVFEGPAIVGEIVRGIKARLQEEGFKNLQDAVGSGSG